MIFYKLLGELQELPDPEVTRTLRSVRSLGAVQWVSFFLPLGIRSSLLPFGFSYRGIPHVLSLHNAR